MSKFLQKVRVISMNLLIIFTKWYTKADRIRLEWIQESDAPEGVIKSRQTPNKYGNAE